MKAAKPVKKFKGKKKVSNVIEKKQKGLKLNQVDRKKIVKIEEKNKQKEAVKNAVKEELRQLAAVKDEDTGDSLNSESSFGSQAVKAPKKRVSFAGNEAMEKVKVFDKSKRDLVIRPSEAEPGKGILRKRQKKTESQAASKKAKVNSGDAVSTSKGNKKSESTSKENDDENDENFKTFVKPKKTIQVTKKVKEQLLNMDRKERKQFLRELKMQKSPLGKTSIEMKQLWEKVRSSKTTEAEKNECVSKLVGIVKGNAAKLIYAHDTCRVIECLLAQQRQGITDMLFNELTPEIVRMTKSVYSRFFVLRMLKYGTKQQRNIIIDAFKGHAVSLMRIGHAAEVLETAFNEFANELQRYNIVSEFYGKEFVIFRSDTPRTLDQIITEEPAKKKLILQFMEEHLQGWVEKTTIRLSLTHRLLRDFLTHCDEDQHRNMVDSLKDKIPELVHTPDGSYVAMKIIWGSNAKDRKLIVKNFKDLSMKAAMEHYGHRVIMAILDTVDDTVLVNKFIVSELSHEIKKLITDPWGEKVLHYLVHPRDGRSMDGKLIKLLREGDSNPHSKKEASDRYAELFKGVQESIYTYLAANMEELIFEQSKPRFIGACLETPSQYDLFKREVPTEMRQKCNGAIIEIAKQEFIPMDSDRLHIVEHNHGNFVLINALRCDKDLPDDEKLSVMMVKEMKPSEYASWIACNKGCHVLLKMIQCGGPLVRKKIDSAIDKKKLKQYTFKGALLLREELKF